MCDFTIYAYFTCVKVAKLHGFRGARTAFSESALMRDVNLFDMPVSLLSLSLYIYFDNGAKSESFMASSLRTFKITCTVTRILYRVRRSNLSGLRSKSLPIRHFYSQEKYAQ